MLPRKAGVWFLNVKETPELLCAKSPARTASVDVGADHVTLFVILTISSAKLGSYIFCNNIWQYGIKYKNVRFAHLYVFIGNKPTQKDSKKAGKYQYLPYRCGTYRRF